MSPEQVAIRKVSPRLTCQIKQSSFLWIKGFPTGGAGFEIRANHLLSFFGRNVAGAREAFVEPVIVGE